MRTVADSDTDVEKLSSVSLQEIEFRAFVTELRLKLISVN